MPLARLPVLTIGHSRHSEPEFLERLRAYSVDVVLDVRSAPFSRWVPHFNRPALREWLRRANIQYSFAGRTLGGRPSDESLYEFGRVSYEKIAERPSFVLGLRRIAAAARTHHIAIMCSEADPIECHRFLLIGRRLAERSVDVFHVLASGEAEGHTVSETRLLTAAGLAQSEIFSPSADALGEAYARQASRVAFAAVTRPEASIYKHFA